MSTWKSDAVWGLMAAAAIGYEVHTLRADKLEYTLSRTTRRTFRTHHPVGRATFAIGWGWFATWYLRHILEMTDPLDAVINKLKG